MRILIQDLAGKLIAEFQEIDFEGLKTETRAPGGFAQASFTVSESIVTPNIYTSLVPCRIDEGPFNVFDGFIQPGYPHAKSGSSDQGFSWQAVGWMQQLVDAITHGVYLNAGDKASTLITNWIHGGVSAESTDKGDPRLQIISGDIQTTDLTFSSPKYWQAASWQTILDELNAPNGWFWGVWEDKKLDWEPYSEQTDYFIWLESADVDFDSGLEDVVDLVIFPYRPDFGEVSYGFHPDEGWDPALTRVHRTKLLETGNMGWDDASAVAEAYYDTYSVSRIKGPVTCVAITNRLGAEVPLWSVRAGSKACVMGYRYWETLDSFRIARTSYDHDAQSLTLEREEPSAKIELMMARIGG